MVFLAYNWMEVPMRPDLEIITKVSQYLDHQITLSELEEWIVSSLSYLVSLAPSTVQELVGTVELGLAEMSNGSRSEDEFRDMLQNFVRAHPTMEFNLAESSYRIQYGSSTPDIRVFTVTGEAQQTFVHI
jgi:uncharacterized protein YlxP (DUF503 family)